jgi:CheY-like chemotaxis protein
MNEIFKAARRSTEITRQLLAFSRQQPIAPRPLDLNETVESLLRMLRRLIGEDIDLIWQPGPRLWPVYMDPIQVDQILVNLCVNARDAIDDVGRIIIETTTASFDAAYCAHHVEVLPGDYVVLSVTDDGCGMDSRTRENVFEPFYTTKGTGKGTGLGLATVYGIVKQNKGLINIYSEPGQGSIFRIYLPRNKEHEITDREKKQTVAVHPGNETLLLVEDDPSLLRMTSMMLERQGYHLLKASTIEEALTFVRDYDGDIQLMITDVIMPDMNGRELADQVKAIKPDVKVLFMSGYTASVIADRGILDDGLNFIQKPFTKQDLAVKVRETLDRT